MVLSSLFFKEIWKNGMRGHGLTCMFADAKGKQQNWVGLTVSVSGTVHWLYPILPFGIVPCKFFVTTFLEIVSINGISRALTCFKFNSISISSRSNCWIGHFRVSKNLTFKARLSAKPLIWKWVLIMMQIKLIFTTKVSHLASFWKWDFLELGNGLFRVGHMFLCYRSKFKTQVTYFICILIFSFQTGAKMKNHNIIVTNPKLSRQGLFIIMFDLEFTWAWKCCVIIFNYFLE